MATGKELRTLQHFIPVSRDPIVNCVAFTPDGKALASGIGAKTDPGEVKLWDVATGKELATLTGHANPVRCVAFMPDGGTLASGSGDGAVKLWDVAKSLGQQVDK